MNLEKKTSIVLGIALVILAAILVLELPKGQTTEINCLTEKTTLYMMSSCSACKTQANILGEDYDKFKRVDCMVKRQDCIDAEITVTPTWVINGEHYTGVKTLEQLEELGEC